MDEKQQQMEKDWKVSEGLDRVWLKVREKEARDNDKPEAVLSNLMDKQSEKFFDNLVLSLKPGEILAFPKTS